LERRRAKIFVARRQTKVLGMLHIFTDAISTDQEFKEDVILHQAVLFSMPYRKGQTLLFHAASCQLKPVGHRHSWCPLRKLKAA
jgi:hypothetical protein